MPIPSKKLTVDEILKKYGSKIESNINTTPEPSSFSKEYVTFKEEMAPEFSRYEQWCKSLGSLIKLNISKKDEIKIKKYLDIAHIDVEPWQALTLSVLAFLTVFIIGLLISIAVILINGSFASFPFLFFILVTTLSAFLFYFFNAYPQRLANQWRLKASSQMVPAILYIVIYMRHTPNLEKAIAFASDHLEYPLSLDFKKVFYDVEIGKFSTIKESLDNYLEIWRTENPEFIESFHLIESSLFEPVEAQRIGLLEKALQVILDGVYDRMLKFTHDVRSPLVNVYMLGVVLPTLALALLPLASAMLGGLLKWYHVIILFDLIIPFFVYYLTDKIMFLRPGGYGESEFLEKNSLYGKYRSNAPYFNAFIITLPFFIIGIIPLLFQYTALPQILGIPNDFSFAQIGLGFLGSGNFFGFFGSNPVTGPFGIGALIFSMFISIGVALFFSMAFKEKTKELIIQREKTKQLEAEFNNSLFQLGNRIGNGIPPELAFGKVAESTRGLITEDFFRRVNYNITQMGMSVEKAIFDPKRGAIILYPSGLISTSMRVLIESSKKGLNIAAISLMSISEYVKNIGKITDRLNDLLAEVVSDMKSNMTFLAPLLSGIVIGLAAMITSILTKLNISSINQQASQVSGLGSFGSIISIFDVTQMIPAYYLQIAIGIYLIEITFILTRTLVAIDSGEDELEKTSKTGKNLIAGISLYFITAFIATFALSILSSVVLGGLGG